MKTLKRFVKLFSVLLMVAVLISVSAVIKLKINGQFDRDSVSTEADAVNFAVDKKDTTPNPTIEGVAPVKSDAQGSKQQTVKPFCKSTLEPLGFSLVKEEYFSYNTGLGILLYFDSKEPVGSEAKKQAAILLSQYIYTTFDAAININTAYLKVHFKQPEGESFALERKAYLDWKASGASEQILFEKYIASKFADDGSKAPTIVNQAESPVKVDIVIHYDTQK